MFDGAVADGQPPAASPVVEILESPRAGEDVSLGENAAGSVAANVAPPAASPEALPEATAALREAVAGARASSVAVANAPAASEPLATVRPMWA